MSNFTKVPDFKKSPLLILAVVIVGLIIISVLINSVDNIIGNIYFWFLVVVAVIILVARFVHFDRYRLLGIIFIIAGIFGLGLTGFQFFETLSFQKSEIRTTGVVLSIERHLIGGRIISMNRII